MPYGVTYGTVANPLTGTHGAIPSTSNSLLTSTVSSILGLKSDAATSTANAAASTTQAAGYAAEGAAYGNAAGIAEQNAIVATLAGNVKGLQEQRTQRQTEGQQRAAAAANGFGASGSNLDIIRDSISQGYLTQQLTAMQTTLTKGGYQQEEAASVAEENAAIATGNAATAAATSYTAASKLSTANAANETAALNNFIGTSTLTADQSLILSPLGKDVTQPTTIPASTATGTAAPSALYGPTGIAYAPGEVHTNKITYYGYGA